MESISESFLIPELCLSFSRSCSKFLFTFNLFRPELIDYKSTSTKSPKERMEQAFSVAEKELGIARLLEPEGKNRGVRRT